MTGFKAGWWRKKQEDFAPTEAEYPHSSQPRLIREAVECACVRHQLSPALYATVAQAAASLAVQGLAELKLPDGSMVPLSIYFLVIAKSSMGKSRAYETFFAPFMNHDEAAEAAYLKADELYPSKHSDWKSQTRDLNKRIGKRRDKREPYEHLQAELDKLNEQQPQEPRRQNWLMSDTTGSFFLKRLKGFDQSIGLAGDEGSKIFKYLYQYLADLCQAWGRGHIDNQRVGSGITLVHKARVMALILAQPDLFYDFCATQGSLAYGLGAWARFLINAPSKPEGTLTSDDKLDATTAPIETFLARIVELIVLRTSRKKAGITEQDVVELDADARNCWNAFVDEMRTSSGAGGNLFDVSEFAGKAPMHAVRLAAVFAYFCGESKITLDMMQRAICIVRYHIDAYCDQFSIAKAVPKAKLDALKLETYFRRLYLDTRCTSILLDSLHHSNTTSDLKVDKNLLPALICLAHEQKIRIVSPPGKKTYINFRRLVGFAV